MRPTAQANLQVVQHQNAVLEKPADADDAQRMLPALSGSAHMVHTGVALVVPQAEGETPKLAGSQCPLPAAWLLAAQHKGAHSHCAGRRVNAHELSMSSHSCTVRHSSDVWISF